MKSKVANAVTAIVIPFIFLVGSSPSGLLITISGNCPPGNIGDQKWKRLRAADFPARVKAVVFKKDVVLDADHSVSLGKWTISFDGEPPIAEWKFQGANSKYQYYGFEIDLVCTNSVLGQSPCILVFEVEPEAACGLRIKKLEKDSFQLGIPCPADVQFEK